MESIAYIIAPQMIFVAMDSDLILKYPPPNDVKNLEFDQVRKVAIINDTIAFAGVGVPRRIVHLLEFFKNLKPDNQTFDSVAADMLSLFKVCSIYQLTVEMGKMMTELKLLGDKNGKTIPEKADHYLNTHENEKASLSDIKELKELELKTAGTDLFLFGWEDNAPRNSIYVILGNYIIPDLEYHKTDQVIIYCTSCLLSRDENKEMQKEAQTMLEEVLDQEKDVPPENLMIECPDMYRVSEKYMNILDRLIQKMSRYKKDPFVVYYELSAMTNFKFKPSYIYLDDLFIAHEEA